MAWDLLACRWRFRTRTSDPIWVDWVRGGIIATVSLRLVGPHPTTSIVVELPQRARVLPAAMLGALFGSCDPRWGPPAETFALYAGYGYRKGFCHI